MKRATDFIGRLIDSDILSKAQARALEIFVYTTLISAVAGIAENAISLMLWNWIAWDVFFTVLASGTALSIQAGISKYSRDKIIALRK